MLANALLCDLRSNGEGDLRNSSQCPLLAPSMLPLLPHVPFVSPCKVSTIDPHHSQPGMKAFSWLDMKVSFCRGLSPPFYPPSLPSNPYPIPHMNRSSSHMGNVSSLLYAGLCSHSRNPISQRCFRIHNFLDFHQVTPCLYVYYTILRSVSGINSSSNTYIFLQQT